MAKYRDQLPQLSHVFLTDGGLETTLVFHQGWQLPDFAAFDLLNSEAGKQTLREYFRSYAAIARKYGEFAGDPESAPGNGCHEPNGQLAVNQCRNGMS
jgi:hypothetical protein